MTTAVKHGRRIAVLTFALAILLVGPLARLPHAQVWVTGNWSTLPYTMPINPVHVALMNNGKVLIVSGSGNVATETNYRAAVWDPDPVVSRINVTSNMPWDMFCNGMVVLPDGRVMVNGGTQQYDPFHGQLRSAVFDPNAGAFTDIEMMAHGRWYPTVTVLGDGRVMTFSGSNETGGTNTAVELYTVGSGWSTSYSASWTPPLYPRLHLLTDGRVFYSGSTTQSRIFNPSTKAWSNSAVTKYSGTRTYGTSVLLPLSPADNYRAKVMIMGGGNPATTTTEIIEPLASSPAWAYGPSMSQARIEMNATILPNGKVLATGGSVNDEDTATASYNADLYDPASNSFSPAGQNAFARLYHSGSLLLPDATVALLGGNPARGTYETHIEIYRPAYLYNSSGGNATRPTITGVSSSEVPYGSVFQVFTSNAANISSVVLIRPGAPTHAFDMEQRLIKLNYVAGASALDVTAPPNGNIAPPGYYMLFILDSAGVPSIATFVHLAQGVANQPPSATITAPTGNVTVQAGQSVSFSGSGTDTDGTISAYSWSFPGGNPSSSTIANSGAVTYSTPGTYTASFTVTDNGGLASTPATRTVTVPDFSIGASPSSQTVVAGSPATYGATVTMGTGFIGTVGLTVVSGLPTGATASFNPSSISATGTSTLTVTTTSSTPGGTYQLSIQGTSGNITHTATVTLVVTGDFTISASPSTTTVSRNGTATYTVSVGALQGFAGTVTLSVTGVPKQSTPKFTPASITTSGTSTLTIGTRRQTATGSFNLTISGTSGSLTHTAKVTIVVQ